MNANKINADILELVFAHRNKAYGAYELRKTYSKRLVQSLIAIVALTILVVMFYFVDLEPEEKATKIEVKEVKLADIKDEVKDIPPPPPPQEMPQVEVKKFTELLLEKKDELKPEELKPQVNLDELVDANIGVKDIEGIKTTDIAPPPSEGENTIFTKVEINAEPNGGKEGWSRYLRRNLNASVGADNGAPAGRYTIICRFVVEKNGSLTDIQTVGKKHGYGMEEEAIRVLKESPAWTPGQQNGKSVRSLFTQPITFVVQVD